MVYAVYIYGADNEHSFLLGYYGTCESQDQLLDRLAKTLGYRRQDLNIR